MKKLSMIVLVLAAHFICFAQESPARVVISSEKLYVECDGKTRIITGENIPNEDLAYRTEQYNYTLTQYITVWQITENESSENEYGKCFDITGYRIEFSPNGRRADLLPGDGFIFWGAKAVTPGEVTLQIKKMRGFPSFDTPIILKLVPVKQATHNAVIYSKKAK